MRQVTHGPNEDSGPRWSPDGTTLTFLSDRAVAGSAQLYALETGVLGEARQLAEAPGIVEHHEWSPDGSRILLLVAGHGAEQTDALGSGTLGARVDLPEWVPLVSSSDGESDARRSLHVLDVASGELAPASPTDLNVWEASWCGARRGGRDRLGGCRRGCVVRRRACPRRSGRAQRSNAAAQRGAARLGGRLAGWHARRGGRGRLQRSHDRGRRIAAGRSRLRRGSAPSTPTESTSRWTAWRDDERLFAIGVRGLEPVALDVHAADAVAAEIWVGSGSCGASLYPSGSPIGPGRAFAAVVEAWDRAPSVVARRRRGRSRPGRLRARRDDGSPRGAGRPAPRALERTRRPRDRGLPHPAARRAAVPDDPAHPRRPHLGLPGHAAARQHPRADRARLRDLRPQRARLDGLRARVRVTRRRRHGRRRRRRHALGPRSARRRRARRR